VKAAEKVERVGKELKKRLGVPVVLMTAQKVEKEG